MIVEIHSWLDLHSAMELLYGVPVRVRTPRVDSVGGKLVGWWTDNSLPGYDEMGVEIVYGRITRTERIPTPVGSTIEEWKLQ